MVSCVTTGHIIAARRVQEEFRTVNHAAFLIETQGEVWKRNVMRAEV